MLTKFKLTALFLFALFLSSCSNIGAGRDSSVTVSLGSDALKYLSARGAESTEDSESEKTNDESTYFLTVSLKGDYSATQSAKISEEGASITFGEIPVESKIYAEGAVYKGNEDSEEKEVLYEGKSETIKISEGENSLSLVLKKVEKKPADAEEPAEEEALSFTVKFYSDEETLFASQTVKEGETATEPESPSKDGYVFTGWYASADFGQTLSSTAFDFSEAITSDIILYAKWKEPAQISLIYDGYSTRAEKREFNDCNPDKLFDNDTSTKLCIDIETDDDANIPGGIEISFHASNPCLITKYALTQGNDTSEFPNRAPVAWQILGADSPDGTYTEIEKQDHTASDAPLENTNCYEGTFDCQAQKAYQYYKFIVTRLYGATDQHSGFGGTLQLSELKFYSIEFD